MQEVEMKDAEQDNVTDPELRTTKSANKAHFDPKYKPRYDLRSQKSRNENSTTIKIDTHRATDPPSSKEAMQEPPNRVGFLEGTKDDSDHPKKRYKKATRPQNPTEPAPEMVDASANTDITPFHSTIYWTYLDSTGLLMTFKTPRMEFFWAKSSEALVGYAAEENTELGVMYGDSLGVGIVWIEVGARVVGQSEIPVFLLLWGCSSFDFDALV